MNDYIYARAKLIKSEIQNLAKNVSDEVALKSIDLYDKWKEDVEYAVDDRVVYDGHLYKCIQSHTSQLGWEPSIDTASLWNMIDETHAGTQLDPIPYNKNMALENGKYYIQNEVVYKCTRDTINTVYDDLSDLVNIYVEISE